MVSVLGARGISGSSFDDSDCLDTLFWHMLHCACFASNERGSNELEPPYALSNVRCGGPD